MGELHLVESFKLRESDEINSMMELMQYNDQFKDDPYVGSFWYDPNKDELFGVYSVLASDTPLVSSKLFGQKVKTGRKLHKDIWKKETYKKKDSRFRGDHTLIPRGRVFQLEDGTFKVMVGDWIDKYPEAKEEILYEFQLPEDTDFVKDYHWNIGHGFSDEFLGEEYMINETQNKEKLDPRYAGDWFLVWHSIPGHPRTGLGMHIPASSPEEAVKIAEERLEKYPEKQSWYVRNRVPRELRHEIPKVLGVRYLMTVKADEDGNEVITHENADKYKNVSLTEAKNDFPSGKKFIVYLNTGDDQWDNEPDVEVCDTFEDAIKYLKSHEPFYDPSAWLFDNDSHFYIDNEEVDRLKNELLANGKVFDKQEVNYEIKLVDNNSDNFYYESLQEAKNDTLNPAI